MSTDARSINDDRRIREAGDWLLRLRDRALPDAQVAEWIRWCEADPENLAAFERMESLWTEVGRAMPPAITRGRASWLGGAIWMRPAAVFASAVIVLAAMSAAIYSGLGPRSDSRVEPPRVAPTVSATVLPDGSTLEVGARTLVSVNYGKERRLEMKDGEAYFHVAPDKSRPFVVDAGPIEVRAVGTAFDIRRNTDRVSVSVIEGKVEVAVLPAANAGAGEPRKIILAAGHEFKWESDSTQTRIAQIEPAAAAAWRAGRLDYVKESLKVVVADANRYSSRPIELGDIAAGQLEFTGTVFTRSIDDWLDALPHAFPLVREDLRDRTVLKSRP